MIHPECPHARRHARLGRLHRHGLGVVMMFPLVTLNQIQGLSMGQYAVLVYCCANMLLAYGCFAEALAHWEASRVSAVVAISPLLTLAMSVAAHSIWPEWIMPEELNALGLLGAVLVVVGSVLAALGGRRHDDAEPTVRVAGRR